MPVRFSLFTVIPNDDLHAQARGAAGEADGVKNVGARAPMTAARG